MNENNRLPKLTVWCSSIWDAVAGAIIVIDEDGFIEDCNCSTEAMFGHGRRELVGRNVGVLIPDLRAAIRRRAMEDFITGCREKALQRGHDFMAQKKDGSDLPVHLELGMFSVDKKRGFVCFLQDVSARKQIEDRLRQREEQLTLTIEHAPTGMATVDLDGKFLTVNKAFSSMVGYEEEELAHRPVNSITHPDDIEQAESRLQELRDGKIDNYRMQKRYIRKDGGTVEAVLNTSVVHDSAGKPLLYVAQTQDLTDQLEAERDASEVREKLAHVTRLHMIGEMATGMAHEINQPLTAISTYAQACRRMIEAGMMTSDEVLEAMDKISHQAQRAGDVIDSLRGLVRKRSSARTRVDLNALIRDVAQLAEVDARMHEASIKVDLAKDLPQVLADPVQVQQVLLNLLLNAMQAVKDPGCSDRTLTVATGRGAKNSVEVSVKDHGVGISSEAEKQLFQTFFTTKTSGMGMGLAISRSIINAHGGSLWFTRNPEGGTTFFISIPAIIGESDGQE